MVAKIMIGKSVQGALTYNEQKVIEGKAQLILAGGFASDIEQLNFNQKLQRFEHLTALNPRVKTNALHISLNFDAAEKLTNEQLQRIAVAYMEKIGFGEQPFLVYRHRDAAHTHVHLVTTSMQRDGKPIRLHHIGRLVSEPARKQIEQEFGLVRAESKQFKQHIGIKPADPEKAVYGHIPTKRAISNVVTAVMNSYKYTSLSEFNAVLNQFNVVADRGAADTQQFQKKGLLYFLLDGKGNKIGVPIKASSLHSKPTLANLEKKFAANEEKRKPYREVLKTAIDKVFKHYKQITRETFIKEMADRNVNVLFRLNEQGFTYGLTLIDHNNRTVFNGSDLGKAYSAKAIQEKFGVTDQLLKHEQKPYLKPTKQDKFYLPAPTPKNYLPPPDPTGYLKGLLGNVTADTAPVVPKKKKKNEDQGLDL
jgi:Relaxase/Mobilisation nuclease domain